MNEQRDRPQQQSLVPAHSGSMCRSMCRCPDAPEDPPRPATVPLAPLAAAQRRVASPRVIFRLSEPRLALSGVASELTGGAEQLVQQIDQLHDWLATATGRPKDTVAEDMKRGRSLDAEAASDYGLLDEILAGRGG